ncbi:hypothetical protein AMTRI_Chr02g259700 [Amborella trichopoda]
MGDCMVTTRYILIDKIQQHTPLTPNMNFHSVKQWEIQEHTLVKPNMNFHSVEKWEIAWLHLKTYLDKIQQHALVKYCIKHYQNSTISIPMQYVTLQLACQHRNMNY